MSGSIEQSGLGRHILAEFYGCDFELLNDPERLKRASLDAVQRSGATLVSHHFKTFEPQGVSGVIVIAESHLSFHTWPEHGYMALDYFTCGDRIDIHLAVDLLERALQPSHTERTLHWRGAELAQQPYRPEPMQQPHRPEPMQQPHRPEPMQQPQRTEQGAPADEAQGPPPAGREGRDRDAQQAPTASDVAAEHERWVTEYHLNPETRKRVLGFGYRVEREIATRQSDHQQITVARSPVYGRMMLIDGYMMTTERDEFVYHEMLGHVPLVLHPRPRRVLIVGGGDGGLAREVLRHEDVERVDLVELDDAVIEMSRAHLPALGAAFDDPRLTVHLTDGARFVARAAPERYDVVLVDSTDPIGPAKVLFQEPFYRGLRRALRPGGLLGAQAMSPWLQEREQREMFSELGRVWPHVHAYHATVPTYPGGQWVFAIAAEQAPDLTGYDRGRARTVALDCRYYTAELQLAAFHLPRFITQNTVDVAREARDERAADPPDPPTRHDREPDDRAWSN